LPLVCGNQFPVGDERVLGFDDCLSAAAQEFGAVGAESLGQLVEVIDEIVVELYEYFASRHGHMLSHMVCRQATIASLLAATSGGSMPATVLAQQPADRARLRRHDNARTGRWITKRFDLGTNPIGDNREFLDHPFVAHVCLRD
jgi:hypothetical protein